MNNFLKTTILGLLVLALFPVAEVRAEDHVRDGWFIGMGYGYGRGAFRLQDESDHSYRNGATPQIRFGHSVGNHFMAGVEYGGWMFEEGDVDNKFRYSLQTVTAAVTWHPGQSDAHWGGFYVRAGVGYAWASGVKVDIEDQEQVHSRRIDEGGLGLIAQIGYEFRITSVAAVGLSAGYTDMQIDGELFEEARYVPLALTLNWYWD